jgi:hypothetical protein
MKLDYKEKEDFQRFRGGVKAYVVGYCFFLFIMLNH